jgi:NAD(P)H-quinone oxidoreductase subunit 5
LFLASGAGAQEWRLPLEHPPKIRVFLLAFLCGALGTAAFTWSSHMKLMAGDTTLFLIGLSLIAGTQLALPILRNLGWKSIATAAFATTLIGAAYGLSIEAFKYMLAPMDLFAPQELNTAHIMGYGILLLAWLSMTFSCRSKLASSPPRWMVRGYVAMLNAAQPHPRTITTHRNNYNF